MQSLSQRLTILSMAGMYHLKDLLRLACQEGAEELILESEQPPRMRLHGKIRVLDGSLLTGEQVAELLLSISTGEQRRELELCGDAHFRYTADYLGQFSVHARTEDDRLHVKLKYLSPC